MIRRCIASSSGALLLALAACSSTSDGNDGKDKCAPDDADGVTGGNATFQVTVDDTAFTPAVLKVQNRATVSLTLKNAGTKPHGFAIGCVPTPNSDGCPATSCFDAGATIEPIAAGASVTVTFTAPVVEGLYDFKSDAQGDTQTGQFIVQ